MLDETQRAQLERLLQRERKQLQQTLERNNSVGKDLEEQAGELSSYRLHPADLATEGEQREKDFMFASMESERLYQVDEALRRLYGEPERYGVCERCGEEIPFERLEVIPETLHCITCERRGEAPANPREVAPLDPEVSE